MTEPLSSKAADELAVVDQTRARSIRAAQAPLWADAVCAAMIASAWALAMTWRLIPVIIAVGLFIGGFLVGWRATRRKGRLRDDHATKAHMLRYFVFMGPLIFGANFVGAHFLGHGRPLRVIVFAVLAGVVMFAYLRSEARYQAKRLTAGDFHPWDVV